MTPGEDEPTGINISRAAANMRRQDRARDERRRARHAEAERQLDTAVTVARRFPSVQRVRTWGSILKPDQFTENSDLDLAIEGVASPEEWGRLERALLDAVTIPLDLVRWEELMEPHRESIIARGTVLYESD
jgi:predicted nucleotidyltransferase